MIPDKIQHMPANSPTTEAVIALSKDRAFLVRRKHEGLNTMWCGYADAVRAIEAEIFEIDTRIDKLIREAKP